LRKYADTFGVVWTITAWPDEPGSGRGPEGHGGMPSKGLMFESSAGWFLADLSDTDPNDLSGAALQPRIDRRHGASPGRRRRSSRGWPSRLH